MANLTAFKAIYSKLVSTLTRTGVSVGSTANYPRIEINTITESARLEKSGALRQISLAIDTITTDNLQHAHSLNDGNLTLISALEGATSNGYTIIGYNFNALQQTTETSDTQTILYRITQNIDFFMVRTGEEPNANN